MKNTLIATALAAIAPLSAQADLLFTVGAQASYWDADSSGHIDQDVQLGSDGLDVGSDTANQLSLFIEHPLPLLPNVKLRDTRLDLGGNADFSGNFLGQSFNEPVHSQLDLSHTDLTLYWQLPIPLVDINLGMTTRQFDGKAAVYSATSGGRSADLDFTLPMAFGEVKVGTPFGLYGMAEANYVALDGNRVTDISYGVGYDLPIPLPLVDIGLEAGYRSLSMQTDDDYADLDTDLKVEGAWYGASLSVGF